MSHRRKHVQYNHTCIQCLEIAVMIVLFRGFLMFVIVKFDAGPSSPAASTGLRIEHTLVSEVCKFLFACICRFVCQPGSDSDMGSSLSKSNSRYERVNIHSRGKARLSHGGQSDIEQGQTERSQTGAPMTHMHGTQTQISLIKPGMK